MLGGGGGGSTCGESASFHRFCRLLTTQRSGGASRRCAKTSGGEDWKVQTRTRMHVQLLEYIVHVIIYDYLSVMVFNYDN